ncbi:MAG: hypothetical protein ABJ004_06330 [Cyclobacteriaceae bacterium]
MNNFVLELWDDEGEKCTFYTVRWEDHPLNETDKFLEKYEKLPEYKGALQELLSFILDAIGDDHGAIDELFNRHENEVEGLPLHGKVCLKDVTFHYPEFPLRIYALRLSERLVVLFNGGIKDGPTNQQSSLCGEWRSACEFAKKINSAWLDGIIETDATGRVLRDYRNNEEIIL